jgi:hypothetical protein
VDKAIAESPEESLGWFFKALLCHRAGYHIAGHNAWDMLFASDGITRSLSPVEVFNLREEQYNKCSKSLRSYEARLEASERDCSMQKRRVFNPDLAEFDRRVQAYQQGRISDRNFVGDNILLGITHDTIIEGRTSDGNFVRDLFKGALQVPKSVQMFLKALDYAATLNFSAVDAERGKLFELLIEKLDYDNMTALQLSLLQWRRGWESQTDFYSDLQKIAEETGIDISPLRALSAYLHYNTLVGSIDSSVFLGEVWNTIQRKYHARAKSSEERRLIETTTRLHLLRRLLDYLSGKTSVARISATYASNPIAREMEKSKVPFWKKLFGRSR